MNPRFAGMVFPDDHKWFARRQGLDLDEKYHKEFVQEYKPVWDFWQKDFHRFDPNPRPIWGDSESDVPGFNASFEQPVPSVGIRIHEGEPRSMMLVCPGGGWFWKACYEGPVVAERLYDEGFNVAVLDYRVNPYPGNAAREDAIRAIRYLRCHAKELNTLPDKIGMMGFSAGSMLTGWCATMFDAGDPEASDPVERCSSRPDAAGLCYGAGSNIEASRGLLGYNRQVQAKMAETAIERRVSIDCPPFYIWQCAGQDDPRNGTQLADALATVGVPFELHIFPYGNHGMGLANEMHPDEKANDPHVAHWVEMYCEWLRINGF